MSSRFNLTGFNRYRIQKAREELAAVKTVNLLDENAMARAIGRLEVALEQLIELVAAWTGEDAPRCPAAHPEDLTPCGGPVVVTLIDTENAGVDGCEHHAARLLASVVGARPVPKPDAPAGIAVRILRVAHHTRPYAWREGQA
jgi:hypothetical protein